MTYYSALHYAAKAEKSAKEAALHNLKNKITNCITEIPQDIKLELNNGVLTLKAGSKVYVPNGKNADGSNKFDEVVVPSDKVLGSTMSANESFMIFVNTVSGGVQGSLSLYRRAVSQCYSGATPPTNGVFFDATNNVLTAYTSSVSDEENFALPVGVVKTDSSSVITSIDQVFNGFGYIGSTVFALPGVKGLIPNGRNEDGSLKNIEFTYTKCATITKSTSYNGKIFFYFYNSNAITYNKTHYEQDTEPSSWVGAVWFNTAENKVWFNRDGAKVQVFAAMCVSAAFNNGVIASLNSKSPFRAVDWSELDEVDYVVERGTNGNYWYRKYKSGWLEQGAIGDTMEGVSGNKPKSFNFLKPFAYENGYEVLITSFGVDDNNTGPNITLAVRATTYFTAVNQGWDTAAQRGFNWYACGQGA